MESEIQYSGNPRFNQIVRDLLRLFPGHGQNRHLHATGLDRFRQFLHAEDWKGKGYSIDPVDLYFAHEGVRRGTLRNFEPALVAGESSFCAIRAIIL